RVGPGDVPVVGAWRVVERRAALADRIGLLLPPERVRQRFTDDHILEERLGLGELDVPVLESRSLPDLDRWVALQRVEPDQGDLPGIQLAGAQRGDDAVVVEPGGAQDEGVGSGASGLVVLERLADITVPGLPGDEAERPGPDRV